ncbi:MAG: tetratricopeptide repeat protein [Acidobacteria bacterium]|nr:tetratricopeptide repeat protein [Acidobacteriota bacterium]MYD71435.1 tetratricopeptide repeat protein [Acidobacteriota bacterium]
MAQARRGPQRASFYNAEEPVTAQPLRYFGQLPRIGPVAAAIAVLAGTPMPATAQAGSQAANTPTFADDIAPLVLTHCAPCHRPGEVAPFPLLGYDDVRRRARQIAEVTASRYMPPWKPEPGYGGPFVGSRRLADADVELFRRWAEAGTPAGDLSRLPATPEPAAEGWRLGEPHVIVRMPEPFGVPADGPDTFRNFVLPIPIDRTAFVAGLEFRPGNARVAHHANLRIDRSRASRELDAQDPLPGYEGPISPQAHYPDGHFLGWTPGQLPPLAEPGMAWRLEPGSDFVIQLHMQSTGRFESIQSSVGLYFTDEPPVRTPVMLRLGRQNIDIPPGDSGYVIRDRFTLPVGAELIGVQPHAHFRAREINGRVEYPDGQTEHLIRIEDWDFNWQDVYRYRDRPFLPAGTTLSMEYVYDNSADNPRNPDRPPRRVLFGQFSNDEMGDLWLQLLPGTEADRVTLQRSIMPKILNEDIVGYESMLIAQPENAVLHRDVAVLYMTAGRTAAAVEHYRRSLELDPASATAHYNLATLLAAGGGLDEALTHFRRAVELRPDHGSAHNNFGAVLNAVGRASEALGHFERAVALEPDNAAAHSNLASALAAAGRREEAIAHYERALELDPSDTDTRAALARLLGEADGAGSDTGAPTSDASGVQANAAGAGNGVTYHQDVAPILHARCVACHRPGAIAPFSLATYADARPQADRIAAAATARRMPPWKPTGPAGRFVGERRLTDDQIATLTAWAARGAPAGESPAGEPPAGTRTVTAATDEADGADRLGPPDLVVTMPVPYRLAPGGPDVYRNFTLPVPLAERRWVRAVELRPGAGGMRAIHHARIMLDPSGAARALDAADASGPGYDGLMLDHARFPPGHFLGWAPGRTPAAVPDEIAWPLDPGADFVLQLHLLPDASERLDIQPEVALHFADRPAPLTPVSVLLTSKAIRIPAGDDAHVIQDSYRLPVAVDLLAVAPHMHYLGRHVEANATLPDGTERALLRIDDWDFNWQDEYRYREPVHLPAGTRVAVRFTFDNSAGNPSNPNDPPAEVRFGPSASDEMAELMLQVLPVGDTATLLASLAVKGARDDILAYQTLLQADPDDPVNHTALAVRYLDVGEHAVAGEHLTRAIALAPEFADAHYNLGSVRLAEGDIPGAIAAFRRAIELRPDYAEAHNNLGGLLASTGAADEAATHFRAAIEADPANAGAHFNLAGFLFGRGDTRAAIEHYRAALEVAPDDADTLYNLAVALRSTGNDADAEEADAHHARALAIDPSLAAR